ncbi:hypothetical protein DUI87_03524 [Hirundo rustica rustica]|uniref:Uncharacterized protein n=1 Tax=Hirundo rustica rustica TaxID=333673 RepID=A0A3M0L1I0_HIRRU|nr:hypothetical protein DUI87_03524 [Hirundo rustica rustica]
MENSPGEKDLGVLVDEKLDMTQSWALPPQKAKRVLGCIQSSVGSRGGRGFCPSVLLCSALLCCGETPLGTLHPAQEGHETAGLSSEEATKMVRGLEHLVYEKMLRELGLLSLEREGFGLT